MTMRDCEAVRAAAMARMDGESVALTEAAVDEHVVGCAGCGEALAGLQLSLEGAQRPVVAVDLWPAVEVRIAALRARRGKLWPVVLGLALLYKLVELRPELGLGLGLKLLVIAATAAIFASLRANPFALPNALCED